MQFDVVPLFIIYFDKKCTPVTWTKVWTQKFERNWTDQPKLGWMQVNKLPHFL